MFEPSIMYLEWVFRSNIFWFCLLIVFVFVVFVCINLLYIILKNFYFINPVLRHQLATRPEAHIIRRKSDNCGTQYKCLWVFGAYDAIAKETSKKILVYYGVAGHGKGLVDAMSNFGCKGPICDAVIQKNFKYDKA